MSAKWPIAVFLITTLLFSTPIYIVTGQEQKRVSTVKIPEADILPARFLQNVSASDSGWVFGYDQTGNLKKMAVKDIPMAPSFQTNGVLDRSTFQNISAAESDYAIGYDKNGALVKVPISAIPDDDREASINEEIEVICVGSGHVFARKTGIITGGGFIKISINDIPLAPRSLYVVRGADKGYVIGFEELKIGYNRNDLRKVPINAVPIGQLLVIGAIDSGYVVGLDSQGKLTRISLLGLSTVVALDSDYVVGLDSQGRLIRISLPELDVGYAPSLASRIIDADSGFVVCHVE